MGRQQFAGDPGSALEALEKRQFPDGVDRVSVSARLDLLRLRRFRNKFAAVSAIGKVRGHLGPFSVSKCTFNER
jgi:hypothetical protein